MEENGYAFNAHWYHNHKSQNTVPRVRSFFLFFLFFFHLPEQLYQIASTEGNMASK